MISDVERVLAPTTQFLITDMMRDVVRRGTAVKAMELKRTDLADAAAAALDLGSSISPPTSPLIVAGRSM